MLEPERHQVPRNPLLASAVLLLYCEIHKKNAAAATQTNSAPQLRRKFVICFAPFANEKPRELLQVHLASS
jgi:hypothetical protein